MSYARSNSFDLESSRMIQNYFDLIPNEIIHLIFSKVSDITNLYKFSKNWVVLDYQQLFMFRYPYLYDKVRNIINVNDKLGFIKYADNNVYKNLYTDLVNSGHDYLDLDMIIRSNRDNFPDIANVFAMIFVYEKYSKF